MIHSAKLDRFDIGAGITLGLFFSFAFYFITRHFILSKILLSLVMIALPFLTLLLIWIAFRIGRKKPIIFQITKYTFSGLLNAGIDFGTLNILSYVFGIYRGIEIIPINIAGFTFATLSSYFWNKHWTFRAGDEMHTIKQVITFFGVAGIGALINSALLYYLTTHFLPIADKTVWLNIAKILASIISIIWNFTGYKIFVFKK